MDSLHVDKTINHFSDDFDAKQFKAFKDEMQQVLGIPPAKLNQFVKAYNGDLEALGIPSAKLNQFIKAYNDDLESVLGELSSTVDVLEILNEGVN